MLASSKHPYIHHCTIMVAFFLPLTTSILSDIFFSGYIRKNIFVRRTADGKTQKIQPADAGRLVSAH